MGHPVLSSLATMATTSSQAITPTGTLHSTMTPFPTMPYPLLATTVPGALNNNGSSDGENTGECKLLGPFSLLVQAALGALALVSLVYKRWKERPQRPLKIWAFDASKQVFGSAMLHGANLLMSMFSAGQLEMTSKYQPNPCSFYLLNLGIDTTLGIPILIFILRFVHRLAMYTPLANPPESIESGNYGHPPRATWWFKQSIIYFIGLLGMKICVFFIIQLVPFVVEVGDWALRWTEGNTAVQIFFVMLLFPVIMNAVQYYIIDTFIKKPIPHGHERLASHDDEFENAMLDDDRHRRSAFLAALDDSDLDDSDDDLVGKGKPRRTATRRNSVEYDPAVDGEYMGRCSINGRGGSSRGGNGY